MSLRTPSISLWKLAGQPSSPMGEVIQWNCPLPPDALHAFKVLQQQLTSDPVMAFPRSDRQYALITDAATGSADFSGGLGAILTQMDKNGNHYAISFASRQLKDHEKNPLWSLCEVNGIQPESGCILSEDLFEDCILLIIIL